MSKSLTPSNTCAYCGVPCPNRFCSWECLRNNGQSEWTWIRSARASDEAVAR